MYYKIQYQLQVPTAKNVTIAFKCSSSNGTFCITYNIRDTIYIESGSNLQTNIGVCFIHCLAWLIYSLSYLPHAHPAGSQWFHTLYRILQKTRIRFFFSFFFIFTNLMYVYRKETVSLLMRELRAQLYGCNDFQSTIIVTMF